MNKEDFNRLIREGKIPPNISIMDMEPVCCNQCGWYGYIQMLKPIYDIDPSDPDEVIQVPGCPACLSGSYLEYNT